MLPPNSWLIKIKTTLWSLFRRILQFYATTKSSVVVVFNSFISRLASIGLPFEIFSRIRQLRTWVSCSGVLIKAGIVKNGFLVSGFVGNYSKFWYLGLWLCREVFWGLLEFGFCDWALGMVCLMDMFGAASSSEHCFQEMIDFGFRV